MNRAKVFNGMSGALAGVIFLALVLYLWASRFEAPFLYYQNLPFPVMATVHAGDVVQLQVERCNSDSITHKYRTTRKLTNAETGKDDLLPDVEVEIKPGCHRSTSKVNEIPPTTTPGTYIVGGIAEVEGRFRRHQIPWYSEPFQVTAKE